MKWDLQLLLVGVNLVFIKVILDEVSCNNHLKTRSKQILPTIDAF